MGSIPPMSPSPYPRPHLQQPTGPPCPRCGSQASKEIKYTWWGGVVGPKMFNLVKCLGCGCQFNHKTGQDATKGIIVYNVVAVGIVLAIAVAYGLTR